MRLFCLSLVIILTGLVCLQCTQSTGPDPAPTPPQQRTPADLTSTEKSLVASTNAFGLKLFRQVAAHEQPTNNIFISPLSVSFALGMTYNGASGETRQAMARALEYNGLSDQEINESYLGLITILTELDPGVVFDIANSIWYRLGKPVRPEFIDVVRTYFEAAVREMDWSLPGAADTINHWVDVNTHGKITKIFDGPISSDVAMILLNAIYFNGAWTRPFDTADTYTAKFHPIDGNPIDCEMMTNGDDTTQIAYFANDLFQAADLPYGDKAFSMTILLPHEDHTVDDIINDLTPENWAAWMAGFAKGEIILGLPKFKFEYDVGLDTMLKSMGMAIAWDPSANGFSNMFADSVGWISQVKHKTFVQVDERGTEAAAVTAVIIVDYLPPMLIADRPFLFVIRERESGTILFMGKISQPVWES